MKKIAIIILSSFVSMLMFGATAFAVATDSDGRSRGPTTPSSSGASREPPDVKVYYSESIGQGDKVYKITACAKARSYAPLRCSESYPTITYAQCKDNRNNIIRGKIVKGCRDQDRTIEGTAYPAVTDASLNNLSGCENNPENQSPKYVEEWAVVDPDDVEGKSEWEWEIKGTIAWGGNIQPEGPIVNTVFPNGQAVHLFKPTLCVNWDKIPQGQSVPSELGRISQEGLQALNRDVSDASGIITELTSDEAGCNNNNSREVNGLNSNNISTPFNDVPTVSCSVQYLIIGKSGADILGKYISMLYKWAGGIVGIISVLVMVFSGVQISMAGGDSAKIDSAKHRIMQSLIGLALLFLSGLLLYTINPGFFTG